MVGRQTTCGKDGKKRMGAWLRELRINAGLTQLDLATRLGLKAYTIISQIEHGTCRLPEHHYAKTADAFGVPRRDFAMAMLRAYSPHIHKMLEELE